MPEFTVHDLQTADPDGSLALPEGVRLSVHEEKDSMGMSVVDVTADSREKLLEFVRYHWGDDDKDWFASYVEARVVVADDVPVECPVCGACPFDSWDSVLRHAVQWHPDRIPTKEMLGATARNLEHATSLPDPRSSFGRSIEGSAGTIVLANGRSMQGWVTSAEDDFVFFVYSETGDNPGCGREITVGAPGDTSRTALVRVTLIAAYEYAGEDGW